MSTRTLILAGHGSSHDPLAGAPVRDIAERIRARGRFDEVHVAFWKEEPFLRNALAVTRSERVFIIPMFLAEGYYTHRVVPRELGIDCAVTRRGSRVIRYCPPVGSHPDIRRLVLSRARAALHAAGLERSQATLAIIGHGTRRITGSGQTVERVAHRLTNAGFDDVVYGFLDQDPLIENALEELRTRDVVLVPFFLADGWHTRVTIPERLAMTAVRKPDHVMHLTAPVGTHPGMVRLVLDMRRFSGDMEMEELVRGLSNHRPHARSRVGRTVPLQANAPQG